MVIINYSDFEWSAETDLSKYAGKWIAILGKKIIAVADNAADASRIAKEKAPSANAFLKKIPKLAPPNLFVGVCQSKDLNEED